MFEKFGPLKRCGIHWNNLGLSKGTADIEYMYPQDAARAKQEYNRKPISGRDILVQWSNNNSSNGKGNLPQRRRLVFKNRLGGNRNGNQQAQGQGQGQRMSQNKPGMKNNNNMRRSEPLQNKSGNASRFPKFNKF
jgi:RNA recognition motif-containing protein